jgi:hypothetical protein
MKSLNFKYCREINFDYIFLIKYFFEYFILIVYYQYYNHLIKYNLIYYMSSTLYLFCDFDMI